MNQSPKQPTRAYKFAADKMVGGLAKWLRLLGFDAVYLEAGPGMPDRERILVTRRSERPHQPVFSGWPQVVRLTSNDTFGQLAELAGVLNITKSHISPMTRCSLCNVLLETVEPEAVKDRVPEYVYATQSCFAYCPGCRRVYWPATHHERMMEKIDRLFKLETSQ